MLRAKVNGQSYEFKEGSTILAAVRAIGGEIPTLCHDDRLKPYGACRLCVVAIKGVSHPVISCHTPLVDEMEIETDTAEIQQERDGVLRLLAHRYPREAIERFPEKPLHRYLIDHADFSVEPLNGVSKGGEHPLWSILLGPGSIPRPRSGFVYLQLTEE